MKISPISFSLSLLGLSVFTAAAEKITYDDHIFPILESSCLNCHNPDKKKGGLDLSTYQGAISGGSGGKIAHTGDGGSSKIFTTTVQTEEPVMPPEGEKIEKKDAELIRAWVDGGLLENKSSKAKKAKKPSISLAVIDPQKRPEGPLPMPKDLLLEPVVVPQRGTVVNDMEASPWAPLLAVTGQRQILLYNTDTLELEAVLPFPNGTPEVVSFHPSGKYLLAGGGIGGKSGTTVTWDVTTGEVIMTMGKEFDSILAADIRADLGGIAMGGPSRLIKLWDTQANEQLLKIKKHTDWVTALSYSHDGVLLATGDRNNGIFIWEAATGNEFHTIRGHKKAIVDLKWRSDSNLVASASEDGEIKFWDMNRGNEVKKTKAHDAVLAMDYARDGHLISSGRDKRVKIWKPDLGLKKELPAFEAEITEVEFTHDAKRFFTADWNGHIQVWDAKDYKEIGTLSSNPPHISARLVKLNGLTSSLAEATEKARTEITKKQAEVTKADNWVKQLQKKIPELKKNKANLEKSLTHEENERKKFETIANQTKQEADRLQQDINQSREAANQLGKKRTEVVAALNKARAEKAADQITSRENELAQLDQNLGQTRTSIDQTQIAHQAKVKAHQDAGKKRHDAAQRKNELHKNFQQTKTQLAKMDKDFEPAKKGLAWTQDNLKKAQQAVKTAEQATVENQTQIKRWRAAEVNTELLQINKTLTQGKESLGALKSDLREAGKAREAQEVLRFKSEIDQKASSIAQASAKRQTLQEKYHSMK